jgi:hypothetical protein
MLFHVADAMQKKRPRQSRIQSARTWGSGRRRAQTANQRYEISRSFRQDV